MSENHATQGHQLGFSTITLITVSLIIGLGIFKTPAIIAANAGTEGIFFAAWIIGGITALCGALTYAEIGARYPVMGGFYQVFNSGYHPVVGFTVNILVLIVNAANLGVVALIGADYLSDLLFGHPSGIWFNTSMATIAVGLFYGVNLLGLKTSAQTQNFMTVLKIGLILILISTVFAGVVVEPHGYENQPVQTFTGNNTLLLLLLSLIAVSFTYGGYQQALNFGSEAKPGPALNRGIIAGTLLAIFLYLAINFAYVQVIGFEKMRNATAIGSLLFEAWFGKAGGKVFDLAMFLSVLTYVNIILLSNPRVMCAMSEDGVMPKIFSRRHPRTGALVAGLTAYAILTIIITLIGKQIDQILSFTMFLDSIGMCTSAATLFILRRKGEGDERVTGTLSKFTPYLAAFFVVSYAMVAVAVVIQKPGAAGIGVALLVGLGLLYFGVLGKATRKVER
jgi:APA family basic amino acid/polyamine antiporter